jgi:LPS-assembly protein
MIFRIRFIITALFVCHLFLSSPLLTSQLRPAAQEQSGGQGTASPPPPSSVADTGETSAPTGDASTQASPFQGKQQPATSNPAITVTTDTQEQDRATEQIIQQEIQQAPATSQELGPPRPATNVTLGRDEVLIFGDSQEKNQDIYKARGHVEIRFRTYLLHADQATYDSTTGQVRATGHVVFDGGPRDEHIVASHGTYDVSRDTGIFYDATGSTGVRVKNKMMFLTSSTPFFFSGKVIEKTGPDRYRVNHGYVTSCQLPKPKWQFSAETATVELGDEARMHHATLRLHGIPVFYFPYVEHPVDNLGRKSGFLIPVIGQSNTRGLILGDAFYWAINRSSDATVGFEYFSARGWAQRALYRRVGYKYQFQAEYYGVDDYKGIPQGQPGAGLKEGGQEIKATGYVDLPRQFRGTLGLDYLSSYLFRLAFGQSFIQAVNSEVRSSGFITRNWDGYFLGTLVSRYQNYQSATPGDFIEINHAPSFAFSTVERPIGQSRFVYAYDTAAEGLSRNEPGFSTPYVGRLDVHPTISWPAFLRGWTFRPEIGARETLYTARLVPRSSNATIGTTADNPINRNVLQASMEIRPPTLAKIFDRKPFGYVLKHTVEPRVVYRYQTGIDNYSQILRFDYRDILADTNEVQYGIVNRLYAKKTRSKPECFVHPRYLPLDQALDPRKAEAAIAAHQACDDKSGPAKEIVTWEIAQKYYMNTTWGGALVPGTRNVFDSTVDLTGISFLTEPRLFSPIVSRLRIANGAADFQWALDYDPVLHQVNASTIFAGYTWKDWYLGGGQTYLNAPGEIPPNSQVQDVFNQYRLMARYGSISKRGINAAFQIGVDSGMGDIQYVSAQTNYNWDCCGITFEYQRFALGFVRNENAYKFALSLTNIGTFGNLRRIDRLY